MMFKSKLRLYGGLVFVSALPSVFLVAACAANTKNHHQALLAMQRVGVGELGLGGFIDDNWTKVTNPDFIFAHRHRLLANPRQFRSASDLVVDKIRFFESPQEPTVAILTFVLAPGNNALESSFMVEIYGFQSIWEQAKFNALQFLESTKFAHTLSDDNRLKPRPSQLNLAKLPTLAPSQNLGFTTMVQTLSNADATGTQVIALTLSRNPNQSRTFNCVIDGFLNDQQWQSEGTVDSWQFVNADQNAALHARIAANANWHLHDLLTAETLRQAIDLRQVVFKRETPITKRFDIKVPTIKLWRLGLHNIGIWAQVYLELEPDPYVKWTSQTYDLYISGFQPVEELTTMNLFAWAESAPLLNAPLLQPRLDLLASHVATEKQLDQLLNPNFKRFLTPAGNQLITADLVRIFRTSADDHFGSLKAEFNFCWTGHPSVSTKRVVTIYGFQLATSPEVPFSTGLTGD